MWATLRACTHTHTQKHTNTQICMVGLKQMTDRGSCQYKRSSRKISRFMKLRISPRLYVLITEWRQLHWLSRSTSRPVTFHQHHCGVFLAALLGRMTHSNSRICTIILCRLWWWTWFVSRATRLWSLKFLSKVFRVKAAGQTFTPFCSCGYV